MPYRDHILLFFLLLCLAPAVSAQTLVVNPGVVQGKIMHNDARAFFYMRMREWPDGTPVRVFVLGDQHPLHKEFSKQVLGVFSHRLRRTWDRTVFAGLGQAPQQVETITEMRTRIAETPGAIGYLPEDEIDNTVRVLAIEGDPGYE